jgi:hypothetical protein
MATDEPRELVMVVWVEDRGRSINTLAYHNGRGLVRVYHRDAYDLRLDMGRPDPTVPIPYHGSKLEALLWMADHRGEQCQVLLRVGVELGWSREELAQEPDFLVRNWLVEGRDGVSDGVDSLGKTARPGASWRPSR